MEMADHPRSAETREQHRLYWSKLTSLQRETADLILSIVSDGGENERQGAKQICELFASHQVVRAVEQARFLANYCAPEERFDRFAQILSNYLETLPENPHQACAIVYNLCGTREIDLLVNGNSEVPEICTRALIFLSGRRSGFVIERMEAVLISIAKAMEIGKGD